MKNSCQYQDLFDLGEDKSQYRLLSQEHVSVESSGAETCLKIRPEALTWLAREAFKDVSFYSRASHLEKLAAILDDPESSGNDRFVALALLQNAVTAAEGVLPMCQDTGTAVVFARKGECVRTGARDEEFLSKGICEAFGNNYLRYSQLAPLSMFEEKNTGTNLPAQIEIHSEPGAEYRFLFLAKGGGSSNKTFLYQETKALLNEKRFLEYMRAKLLDLGTAACPPYHIAVVVGGLSPEMNLKCVKLAAAGYYDGLPVSGDPSGRAFRDLEWEQRLFRLCRESEIGAQFGGKYLAHDVRVIRLPRHAASCPVGIGVSCSADRNIKAKITSDGIFLEQLETNPKRFLNQTAVSDRAGAEIDLDRPIPDVLKQLSGCPVGARVNLSGTVVVARDAAHSKIVQGLREGKPLPEYVLKHPVFYAGPAKSPPGTPIGSFGPTTSARMDDYAEELMSRGASLVMIGKGNRSKAVKDACRKYGGFYLGTIGGAAALFAKEKVLSAKVIDFKDLGMESVLELKIRSFPAFIVYDHQGNDFFEKISSEV